MSSVIPGLRKILPARSLCPPPNYCLCPTTLIKETYKCDWNACHIYLSYSFNKINFPLLHSVGNSYKCQQSMAFASSREPHLLGVCDEELLDADVMQADGGTQLVPEGGRGGGSEDVSRGKQGETWSTRTSEGAHVTCVKLTTLN